LTFKLSAAHRRQLLEGNYNALNFALKPYGCEKGAVYVLNWQRESRSCDDDGNVIVVPRAPLRWIRITSVKRRPDGTWVASFDVVDDRHPKRLIRRTPPATPSGPVPADDASGREESAYTTDPLAAVDLLEAVDEDTLQRFVKANGERWDDQSSVRHVQRLEDRRRRTQGLRWEETKRRARLAGVDLSTDERVIEDRIARAERKLDRVDGEEAA